MRFSTHIATTTSVATTSRGAHAIKTGYQDRENDVCSKAKGQNLRRLLAGCGTERCPLSAAKQTGAFLA